MSTWQQLFWFTVVQSEFIKQEFISKNCHISSTQLKFLQKRALTSILKNTKLKKQPEKKTWWWFWVKNWNSEVSLPWIQFCPLQVLLPQTSSPLCSRPAAPCQQPWPAASLDRRTVSAVPPGASLEQDHQTWPWICPGPVTRIIKW